MAERRSILADLREELGALGGDAAEMVRLRWELARVELTEDFRRARNLLIIWFVCGVVLIGALPVLVVAAAEWLDGTWGLGRIGWLIVLAGLMIAGSLATAGAAWSWFRHRMIALRDTRAELEEDRLWLEEWLGGRADRSEPKG
jgi:uncharacterized membrane protein YqjE